MGEQIDKDAMINFYSEELARKTLSLATYHAIATKLEQDVKDRDARIKELEKELKLATKDDESDVVAETREG